jgi:hypothetical protein
MTAQEVAADQKRRMVAARVKRVWQLHADGWSNRAIARKLGCNEGTVRRDVKKLQLAEQDRILLDQGAAAEPLLRRDRQERKHARERAHREYVTKEQSRRVIEERSDGRHSDAISSAALAWLFKPTCNGRLVDFTRDETINLVHSAAENLWKQYVGDLPHLSLSGYRNVIKMLEKEEPLGKVTEFTEAINYYTSMLIKIMLQIAPETEIRNAAIDKMRVAVD